MLWLPLSAINSLKFLFGICFYFIGVELYNKTSLFSFQALVAILLWTSPMFSPFLWFIASLNLFSIVTHTLVCHMHTPFICIYTDTEFSFIVCVLWFQDWLLYIRWLIRSLLLSKFHSSRKYFAKFQEGKN